MNHDLTILYVRDVQCMYITYHMSCYLLRCGLGAMQQAAPLNSTSKVQMIKP